MYMCNLPRWLAACMLLFALQLLPVCVHAKGPGSHADRQNSRRRGTCEAIDCSHLHYLENANCINQCMSRACFDEVYKGRELEDGEIDVAKERLFKNCIRSEAIRSRHSK